MAFVYDIIAIAVIVLFGCYGARKGIFGTALSLAMAAFAALISMFISQPVAIMVYDKYFSDDIVTYMQRGLEEYDVISTVKRGIRDQLGVEITDADIDRISQSDDAITELQIIATENNILISSEEMNRKYPDFISDEAIKRLTAGRIPDEVVENVAATIRESRRKVGTVIKAVCSSDSASAAQQLEQTLVKDSVIAFIRGAVSFVLFVILRLAFGICYKMLSMIGAVPKTAKVFSPLGLVIGICEGILVLFVLGMCLRNISDNSYGLVALMGQGSIDKSIVFKFFV